MRRPPVTCWTWRWRVRDESKAYPIGEGPRTLFVVRSSRMLRPAAAVTVTVGGPSIGVDPDRGVRCSRAPLDPRGGLRDPRAKIRAMTDSLGLLYRRPHGPRLRRALASPHATPGGGSAAARSPRRGGELTAMVARLSAGRPRYAPYVKTPRSLEAAEAARVRFLALADEDCGHATGSGRRASCPRTPLTRPPRGTPRSLTAAVRAADVPVRVVVVVPRAHPHELEALAGRSNLNAASDLDVGALLVMRPLVARARTCSSQPAAR